MNPISIQTCDVFVIGASLEGCIAAIEAAKQGKKVFLIDNSGSLGQAATNGLHPYLPNRPLVTKKVKEYVSYLLSNAGDKESYGKRFYHDQKLKVVLRSMLDDAGVQVLTHMFLVNGTVTKNELKSYRICGKTGYLDVIADDYIDATDNMEVGASLGLHTKGISNEVKVAVKMDKVSTEAIASFTKEVVEDGVNYFVGKTSDSFTQYKEDITYSTHNLTIYHDKDYKELILSGISAQLAQTDVVNLSKAQAGLRMFCYEYRDELRRNVNGFIDANIIHVSPRIDCYGLRTITMNPFHNLILLNNNVKEYDNIEAIERAVAAVYED